MVFFCISLAFYRSSLLLYINSFLRQCILQTILHTTVDIWVKIAIPESSSSGKTDVTFLALRWLLLFPHEGLTICIQITSRYCTNTL